MAPILAIVHGVTPLAESLTGFGIGATIAVPQLVTLGLNGKRAATIGLLGLCAVPWGSMGPGTLIAAHLGGVGFDELGIASAVASLPVFVGVGLVAALLVATPGRRGLAALAAVGSGLLLWCTVLGANLAFGTAPAGALGAAVTLAVHLGITRARGARLPWSRELGAALTGYAVLLGGLLLASALVRMAGAGESGWRYLASPALWLIVATLVAGRGRVDALRGAASPTLATWLRVGPATALFIVLGVLMAIAGMSGALAAGLASLGAGYLFAVPVIGATGGFITGSNSGANAMFAGPQAAAVSALGAEVLPAMAAHNVAASLLIMAAPARVELAARLCPDAPPQAPIFRTLLGLNAAIVLVLAIGLVLFAGL